MSCRHLAIQTLERRLLLAGNVIAQLKGGWLVVTGDDLGNQIQIENPSPGTYNVIGSDGTTVNGSPVANVTKGIKVDLKKGDDALAIVGSETARFQVIGDLSIIMGDGYDQVEIEQTDVAGKTPVDIGTGMGYVSIDLATFAKDVSVKAGDAPGVEDPWVTIMIERSTIGGNLSVTTGKTNDEVYLDGIEAKKNVTIKTGDGLDYAGVDSWVEPWVPDDSGVGAASEGEGIPSVIAGQLTIDIGKGFGWTWLSDSMVKGNVSLKASDAVSAEPAEDYHGVSVGASTVEGKLTINLGKGDSEVYLSAATVLKDVGITTSDGDDEIWAGDPWDGTEGEGVEEALTALVEDVAGNWFGGKVTLKTGRGHDLVVLSDLEASKDLTVDTGAGNDTVALWQVTGNANVTVQTGDNDDWIAIADLQAVGNLTVNSGNATAAVGGDQVLVTNSAVGKNLSVSTGSGHDQVGVGQGELLDPMLMDFLAEMEWDGLGILPDEVQVQGNLTVATGNGNDGLVIGKCMIGGSASIDTDGGTDEVLIKTMDIWGGASVKMGSGNDDYLGIQDTQVAGTVRLDGGAGGDTLHDLGDNWYPLIQLPKGFEIFVKAFSPRGVSVLDCWRDPQTIGKWKHSGA